jgi:hypothetical protein
MLNSRPRTADCVASTRRSRQVRRVEVRWFLLTEATPWVELDKAPIYYPQVGFAR